ncbi:DinB family protein [Subtercola endophyticus]|uniref:DinB family protein n=1 Tax=Subtercola endophyticus TaxID=2895559 RepID=UPI001E5569F4|nr:DinB family protein [Subtercola endophyticus]UFS60019.1 DinB family protein [Subtercola endophyticus]
MSTITRIDPAGRADDRQSLEEFLTLQRQSVVVKATGLSDADAARVLLPSITTVSGLIRHLADVERSWFREVMNGETGIEYRWSEADPDGEFRVTADDSLAAILADYRAVWAESNEVIASHSLDDVCAGREGRFTLRWIMLHLIEETARHLGHIDILRELLDGVTGE